jgi:hypothetical protein
LSTMEDVGLLLWNAQGQTVRVSFGNSLRVPKGECDWPTCRGKASHSAWPRSTGKSDQPKETTSQLPEEDLVGGQNFTFFGDDTAKGLSVLP